MTINPNDYEVGSKHELTLTLKATVVQGYGDRYFDTDIGWIGKRESITNIKSDLEDGIYSERDTDLLIVVVDNKWKIIRSSSGRLEDQDSFDPISCMGSYTRSRLVKVNI